TRSPVGRSGGPSAFRPPLGTRVPDPARFRPRFFAPALSYLPSLIARKLSKWLSTPAKSVLRMSHAEFILRSCPLIQLNGGDPLRDSYCSILSDRKDSESQAAVVRSVKLDVGGFGIAKVAEMADFDDVVPFALPPSRLPVQPAAPNKARRSRPRCQ
ncbi:hypothetical protein THAOC_17761, partial [Thalassiosira oceanica]